MNKLKIRHGDNEIELEGPDEFIDKRLIEFYKKIVDFSWQSNPTSVKEEILKPVSKSKPPKRPVTPAEFFKEKSKGKDDNISKILIFGKYLENYEGSSEFSRQDINNLVKKAKLPKDIHAQYFTNAVKQGLLRNHGRSRYSLTLSAEKAISSM